MSQKNSRLQRAAAIKRRLIRNKLLQASGGAAAMATKLDKYAKRTFDFFETASGATSIESVASALTSEFSDFGYEYLTVWSVPPPGSRLDGILLNTRPPEYVKRYVECDYVLRDPVVTHLRKTLRTFSWSDVRASRPLSKEEVRIVDEARDFDVRDGLIIPIVTATGSLAIVSPCGRDPDLSQRARSALTMMGMIGHQALKRLSPYRARTEEPHVGLTVREREVMHLVALGKPDADISKILHISITTVLAHVQRAKKKLGATNRVQAALLALERREITL